MLTCDSPKFLKYVKTQFVHHVLKLFITYIILFDSHVLVIFTSTNYNSNVKNIFFFFLQCVSTVLCNFQRKQKQMEYKPDTSINIQS